MIIDDDVFEKTLKLLRIKCKNNSVRIAYSDKYNFDTKLGYMEGYQHGLEIGYIILNTLYRNQIPIYFEEKEITLEEMEKNRENIIRSFNSNDES